MTITITHRLHDELGPLPRNGDDVFTVSRTTSALSDTRVRLSPPAEQRDDIDACVIPYCGLKKGRDVDPNKREDL
jgi:hypothetical protein